jgi:UrcA family protein
MKTAVRFTLTLSTLLLLGSSANALAADRTGEVPTKTVSFRDLDLSTAEGAQALYDRIAGAARVVCRGTEIAAMHACRARAVDDAVKAVGNPLLSSLHRSTVERVEGLVQR